MTERYRRFFSGALVCFVALWCRPAPARAQGVTEWSVEARTALSFRVNEAAVQALLPAGWKVEPSAAAENRGGNLTVTFMERLLVLDGRGKTLRTGTTRYLVMSTSAKHAQTGQVGTLVVGGLSPEGAGAYDVYLPATAARLERSSSAQGEEAGTAQEAWALTAASGERVELSLRYRRGAPLKSHADRALRSAVHPEFTRSYRVDQAADVLRSGASPQDRIDEIRFTATGPRFAPLFDGSEALLSVTSIPWYQREISIP